MTNRAAARDEPVRVEVERFGVRSQRGHCCGRVVDALADDSVGAVLCRGADHAAAGQVAAVWDELLRVAAAPAAWGQQHAATTTIRK